MICIPTEVMAFVLGIVVCYVGLILVGIFGKGRG